MKYLIVLIMCLLATAKVSFQSAFGKRYVESFLDSAIFNTAVFASGALAFVWTAVDASPNLWLYSALFALWTVIFQLSYTKALAIGSVSLTVMLVNLSMIIPVSLSFFLYREPISPLRLVGILLTVAAFIVNVDLRHEKRADRSLIFSLIAMLANAGISVTQKAFTMSAHGSERTAFVGASFAVASVMTLFVVLSLLAKGDRKSFKLGGKPIAFMLLTGVSLTAFQLVNTYAIDTIDGTFLFPVYAGGSIILSALSGIFIFKDKLRGRQRMGLLLGTLAVVLMNF